MSSNLLQKVQEKHPINIGEIIINKAPSEHIFNVGNVEPITIKNWVKKCYACFHQVPAFVNVCKDIEQRNYSSFYNYEYYLDVTKQQKILSDTIPLEIGLQEAAVWYLENEGEVNKKPYFDYIDKT